MMAFIARVLFYPTLIWNLALCGLDKNRRWWDRVDRQLWIGALPTEADVPKLAAEGIGGVVNTCAETEGPVRAYPKYEIEQLHIPTVDFTPPALPDIEKAVAFIDRLHAQGKGVYVHCKAGRGRSATVALCWLVSARDWTPEAAQQHLLNRRPHVNKKLYLRDVVRVFYAKRRQTGSPARPA